MRIIVKVGDFIKTMKNTNENDPFKYVLALGLDVDETEQPRNRNTLLRIDSYGIFS